MVKDCCTAEAKTGVNTGITGFTAVSSGDEDALKSAAATQTIISVGIDASDASFQLYNSGVYAPAKCSSTDLDHGVAVVGYDTMAVGGDCECLRSFFSPTFVPLISLQDTPLSHLFLTLCLCLCVSTDWIVRNSWGSDWGVDGYIYMARNDDNKCGVATDAAFAIF